MTPVDHPISYVYSHELLLLKWKQTCHIQQDGFLHGNGIVPSRLGDRYHEVPSDGPGLALEMRRARNHACFLPVVFVTLWWSSV